ncbi:hypothetical protein Desku_0849 [Desulfofundulus kuznetsovii DSM 6115]|uniref:CARDB domain-containing protein n=1 Tax=Desulfofundulus kuznetsovii (strain DSM 6115 / VKM B-1805 / 17) TaxID=760568 RepID=A0AAU8PFM2_DESK7|nr:hypothetical protein Desku_0849 [Desulfofundulus kuznetsovii DSM 6115]
MLRKLISWVLMTALVLGAVPYCGTASALPGGEGEQVVKQEVIVGYFDIWKGDTWQDTNRDGMPDMPGQKGKTYTNTYSAAEKLKDWTLTRVEVKYPFSPGEYEAAGGRQYGPDGSLWYDPDTGEPGMSWNWFHFWYLDHLPHNLSAKIASQDLAAGKAAVQWTLNLAPLSNALNLKDPENRRYIGYEPGNFGELVEGWRWYLPAIITWYGVPKQQTDLVAVSIDPGVGEADPGGRYTGRVTFRNDSGAKLTGVPIEVRSNGAAVLSTTVDFGPGETRTFTFTWTAPGSGVVELKGIINGSRKIQETRYDNNEVKVLVPVKEKQTPSGPGSLTFQAVSQDRSITRPPNTAKWTDWVTATLKPPAPKPPRGWLEWWKVTSADLTYPKKNPEFTFGTPYPPVGTVTVPMKPNGHEAKVEFQEDWGMDGAKIYSILERKMMAENPKEYKLTARYTVEYEYCWIECDEDGCWTECATATTSGTVSGNLLVNGTGVDSRAQ